MKEAVAEAEACDSTPMTACESGRQALFEELQQDGEPPAVAAQYVPASGLLRVHLRVTDVLEVEAFVVRPAATAYLHSS